MLPGGQAGASLLSTEIRPSGLTRPDVWVALLFEDVNHQRVHAIPAFAVELQHHAVTQQKVQNPIGDLRGRLTAIESG